MPAFPRDLKEIKARQEGDRRPKPQAKDDPLTPELGKKFGQANKEEVKHAHHEDLDTKAFKALAPETQKDLEEGLLALDEIFKWIRGETSRLLDKINQGLADFNEADDPVKSGAAQKKYNAATEEFTKFVNELNNPDGTSFGATINAANIEPIQEGGYYTSARVVIQWLGGTHSDSSMLHVP